MIQLWEHVYISYLKFSVTDSATFVINTLSLHDALPISFHHQVHPAAGQLHVAEAVTTEESHPAGLGQALEGCHVVRAGRKHGRRCTAENGLIDAGGVANCDRAHPAASIPLDGGTTGRRDPALTRRRQGNHTQNGPPPEGESDQGTEEGSACNERPRAVDGIEDPEVVAILPQLAVLFPENVVIRHLSREDLAHHGFCLTICQRHRAEIRLGLHAQTAAEVAQDDLSRGVRQAFAELDKLRRSSGTGLIEHRRSPIPEAADRRTCCAYRRSWQPGPRGTAAPGTPCGCPA